MAASKGNKDVAFLVVPGSFATPAGYDQLIESLHAKGHDAKSIALLTANDGSRLPPATMEDDAEHIRAAVLAIIDDAAHPKNVVITLHSYSGVPGTSALKGLGPADRKAQGKETAVVGILYMAAFLPALGQSNRDIMIEFDAMPEPYKSGISGGYLPAVPAEFAPVIFNDVESQDLVTRNFNTMTQHSSDSYSGKASYEAWKDIPSVQIIPGSDLVVPVPVQEAMHERAAAAGGKVKRVFVEGGSHGINVSQPELVVGEMIKLAEGF